MPELDWRKPYIVYGDKDGVIIIEQDGCLFTARGVFIRKKEEVSVSNEEEKVNKDNKGGYVCETCGKEFSNFNLLNMHKKRFHKLIEK